MRKILLVILIFTIGVALFTQCQQSEEFDITVDQFLLVKDEGNAIIMDVRTEDEYNSGHIENAILLNLYAREFPVKIKDLNIENTYYVYCRSGARSRSAVKLMREEGFSKAFNIKGGILQLTRKGIDLVSE